MADQQTGDQGQRPGGAVPPLRDSVSSAGERIQVIIEAAEKAAAGIIEDADAQAHRYIEESRERADVLADERVRVMSDLTDTLIRQAEMVKRQSDELLAALDAARGELATRIGQDRSPGAPAAGPGGQAPRAPHLHPVESGRPDLQAVAPAAEPPQAPPAPAPPQAAPAPPPPQAAPQPAAGDPSASDGARLLAAQMAVAGSSRQEIEARLRSEFGIEDASPILDGILGPS